MPGWSSAWTAAPREPLRALLDFLLLVCSSTFAIDANGAWPSETGAGASSALLRSQSNLNAPCWPCHCNINML